MKPWFRSHAELHGHDDDDRDPKLVAAMNAAAQAVIEAGPDLPDIGDMILFDLQTDVATRFVVMPVRHVHNQDCGRA